MPSPDNLNPLVSIGSISSRWGLCPICDLNIPTTMSSLNLPEVDDVAHVANIRCYTSDDIRAKYAEVLQSGTGLSPKPKVISWLKRGAKPLF